MKIIELFFTEDLQKLKAALPKTWR